MIVSSNETPQDCDGLIDPGQIGEQLDPAARPVRRTFTAEYRLRRAPRRGPAWTWDLTKLRGPERGSSASSTC